MEELNSHLLTLLSVPLVPLASAGLEGHCAVEDTLYEQCCLPALIMTAVGHLHILIFLLWPHARSGWR